MSLTSLQLFKNLSDETRLGIVLILKEMGELCVCDLCTALDHMPVWAAQVIEQAWLSQREIVQVIARKLASANCSGSGKAVCL